MPQQTFRIGIDVDSVLNDLHEPWLARYNRDYDDALCRDDFHDWDMTRFVKPACGPKIFEYLKDPAVFTECPVLPGAVEATEKLVDARWPDGQPVFDVWTVSTAVFLDNALAKGEWLETHFPHLTNQVWVKSRNSGKGIANVDVLIDDRFDNFRDFRGLGFLFAYPWNRAQWTALVPGEYGCYARPDTTRIVRVDGWATTYELLMLTALSTQVPDFAKYSHEIGHRSYAA